MESKSSRLHGKRPDFRITLRSDGDGSETEGKVSGKDEKYGGEVKS